MHINLKSLLHLSKSLVPNEAIKRQESIRCGKKSYLVRYELTGAEILIIKQIKAIKKIAKKNIRQRKIQIKAPKFDKVYEHKSTQTKEDRFLKHRLNQTFIKSSINEQFQAEVSKEKAWICCAKQNILNLPQKDQINQTPSRAKPIKSSTNKICQTESDFQIDQANQTYRVKKRHAKCDTEDLKQTFSRDQQTDICYFQTMACQTQTCSRRSKCIQNQVETKEKSVQTKLLQCSVILQTDPYNITVTTQTGVSNRHSCVQTQLTETVELGRSHDEMFTLMLTSLKEQSDLLQTGILDALNHLTELTLLGLKKEQDQSKDFIGFILDVPPEGQNVLKMRLKDASLRKYRTWKCPMKCKACGMHKHRVFGQTSATETDCQGTQTDGDTTKVAIVCCSEVATQTAKVKSHWFLRCC